MKILKKFFYILFTIFILLVILLTIGRLYTKTNYKKWVLDYLSQKYEKTMIVKDISFGDIGNYAKVSPVSEPEIEFTVLSKYNDTYLERKLEYDAEKEIESLFVGSNCTASMFSLQSIKSPYPELYELYTKLQHAPSWTDVPQYVKLTELFIKVNENSSLHNPNEIIEKLSSCKFTSHKVDITINNQSYIFNYDESTDKYLIQ